MPINIYSVHRLFQVDVVNRTATADLTNYTPNGEWTLAESPVLGTDFVFLIFSQTFHIFSHKRNWLKNNNIQKAEQFAQLQFWMTKLTQNINFTKLPSAKRLFFGTTVHFIIQKLKSKHLVCLSFLWWEVFWWN